MAITLVTKPENWARVYDTNRMVYEFSSDNYTQPNFNYQFVLKVFNTTDITSTSIGTFNLHPNNDGTVEFNPAQIYTSYLSVDFDASNTTLKELLYTAKKFQLYVYEYYGSPPTRKATGYWYETVPINVYNGCQQAIPYDYTTLNPDSNYRWVMSTGTTKGDWLTDATEYRLDNTDMAFLYGLCSSNSRPDKIRYTIHYWGYSEFSPIDMGLFTGNDASTQQSVPNPTSTINMDWNGGGGGPAPLGYTGWLTAVTYDSDVSFSWSNSLGFYIPCGPYQLINNGCLTPYLTSWAYYDVDAMKGSTVINAHPFRIIKSHTCGKYGTPWQMFWLNPHGGFDTYVFDKKTEMNYKITRDTYKQKLPPTYSTYAAGEKIFNIDSVAEITLRTKLLSQMESQLIIQMTQSPVVYSIKKYNHSGTIYPYGIPIIITTDSIKYEQKVNDKEITMEVIVKESNQHIIQRN